MKKCTMTKMMKMNQMKYYNLIIYYMTNIKNSPFLIGGGAAIGLGLLYFTYNKYQGITNSSTSERQTSVDSDPDIGPPPITPPESRQSSVASSTYSGDTEDYYNGGSRNKKTKKLRKPKNNKRKKLSRKNKNKK